MKHFTCDKCGIPIEIETQVRIDSKNYHICTVCFQQIMEGLDGKGEGIKQPSSSDFDYFKKKFQGY